MDLKDLKNTWGKISTGKKLDEKQLGEMLASRSKSLIERIDRNVKIGFMLLALFIVWIIIDYFVFAPHFIKYINNKNILPEFDLPVYLYVIDNIVNIIFIATFIFFAIKYSKIKKRCSLVCDVRNNLRKIIDTLTLYKRLFYFAVTIVMIEFAVSFGHGIKIGYELHNVNAPEMSTIFWIVVSVVVIIFFAFIAGGIFLFLRWGFNRLYGRYLKRLKATLAEIEEIEE